MRKHSSCLLFADVPESIRNRVLTTKNAKGGVAMAREKRFFIVLISVVVIATLLSGCWIKDYPIERKMGHQFTGYTEDIYIYGDKDEEPTKVRYPTTKLTFWLWTLHDPVKKDVYEKCKSYYADNQYIDNENIRDYTAISYATVKIAEEYLGVDLEFDHHERVDGDSNMFGQSRTSSHVYVRTTDDDPIDFYVIYDHYEKEDGTHYAEIDVYNYEKKLENHASSSEEVVG